jgi:voltage-gated potassium channel
LIRRQRWNLFRGIIALLIVFAIGVVGFKVIEGEEWNWLDAAYMAVITMSTVGFEEVRPLSDNGRVFSIAIIVTGVGAFAYTFATLGEQLISGQLVSNLRQRGTEAMLRRLRGHHIVVGYGNTGSAVATQLRDQSPRARVVVIEIDAELVRNASEDGCIGIQGDAGQDEVLERAGIKNATSLVCAASPDSATLMAVLTARVMAPNLNIIARATLPESESKLLRAGATKVVSMHDIAAQSIADEILGIDPPQANDGATLAVENGRFTLTTGEVTVVEGGPYAERSIGESGVIATSKADIVAVKRHQTGEMVDADDETMLKADDVLILVGAPSHVKDAIEALRSAQK